MTAGFKAIGPLSARTTVVTSASVDGNAYDALIVSASWESRAISAISAVIGRPERMVALRFESGADSINLIKDQQLEHFRENCGIAEVLHLRRSLDINENCRKLQAWIEELYRAKSRPLKLLIDISCIPKSYVMYILSMGFSLDILTRVGYLYSPGTYDLYGLGHGDALGGARSLVSLGDWASHQIPYLNSKTYMRGKRDVYVALGGEIALALPFIERLEPNRLRVAFISDTAPATPDEYIKSERLAYDELIQAPNYSRVDFSLGQGVELAADLLAFARADNQCGVTALAIGCKTHAAGMAIAGLAEPSVEVVTRIPAAYKLDDVRATGQTFFMEFEDRFDPLAYLP